MKKFAFGFLIAVQVLFPHSGIAQQSDNCKICKEKNHDHDSPYSISRKQEMPYLITGTGLALTGFLIKTFDNVVPYTQEQLDALSRNNVNSFDRGATYNYDQKASTASDMLLFGTVVLPAVFLANHHTRNDIGPLLLITYEVAAINYGITSSVKSLVNRNRPYVYNPDLSYDERTNAQSRYSFFSGHTSAAASMSFLFAKVVSDYHPHMGRGSKIGLWIVAAILPATTGYLRVQAGKHYPTDVITGYVVGALSGLLIPELHKRGNENLSFYPTRVFSHPAVGLSWRPQ